MNTSEFWKRRVVLWWAIGILGFYFLVLFDWLFKNPNPIRYGLPIFEPGVHLDFLSLAGKLATAGAGALLFLAAGLGAGAPFGRLAVVGNIWTGRAVALGFGALGAVLLGFGLVGLWYPAVILAAILPAAAAGLAGMVRRPIEFGGVGAFWRRPELLFPSALASWIILLTCLAPESFQDPLRYHFFVPERFLYEHKFVFLERFFYWSYMGPIQMLYGAGLALAGKLWASAINVLCAVLALTTLCRIARRLGLGDATLAIALSLTVTAPGFALVTGAAFVEQALSLCLLLSLESLLAAGAGRGRRLFESLLFLGLAGSVKYTAFFGALGLGAFIYLAGSPRERTLWMATGRWRALGLAAALLPVLPWCASRWLYAGDPISPILARAGMDTLDVSSMPALEAAYAFAGESWHGWLADPGRLLAYPVIFAGAHEGFWEHPGPAIVCLLPAAILAGRGMSAGVRSLLLYGAGSAAAWIVFFGAASPHYVSGFFGIWTLALVGSLESMPGGGSLLLFNLLRFTAFFQALICVVAMVMRFGPVYVAFGAVSPEYYLSEGLAPEGVHYPIRKSLEREFPGRGTVYVYGDDQSYYLSGRVQMDYESGSDPFLWRLAAESRDPRELRKRMRQKDWTHILYSTRWPEALARLDALKFRHDDRTLRLVQEFWRSYARPVLVREKEGREEMERSYVFALLQKPARGDYDPTFTVCMPFLPGAEAVLWEGDELLREGDAVKAEEAYLKKLEIFPEFGLLSERLARTALARGKRARAENYLLRASQSGWKFAPRPCPEKCRM